MVLDKKFYWLSDQYAHDVYPIDLDDHKSHYSWVYVLFNPSTELCIVGACMSLDKALEIYRNEYDSSIHLVIAICLGETDESPEFVVNYLANYFTDKRVQECSSGAAKPVGHGNAIDRHNLSSYYKLNIRDIVQIRRLFWETIEGDHIVGLEI